MTLSSVWVISRAQQRAHACRRQSGKNGDGVDQAFIQHPQNDVDDDQRGQNQEGLTGERALKRRRSSLESAVDGARHADLAHGLLDGNGGLSQRKAGREIEGECYSRELALVIDLQSRIRRSVMHEARERNLSAIRRRGDRADG